MSFQYVMMIFTVCLKVHESDSVVEVLRAPIVHFRMFGEAD